MQFGYGQIAQSGGIGRTTGSEKFSNNRIQNSNILPYSQRPANGADTPTPNNERKAVRPKGRSASRIRLFSFSAFSYSAFRLVVGCLAVWPKGSYSNEPIPIRTTQHLRQLRRRRRRQKNRPEAECRNRCLLCALSKAECPSRGGFAQGVRDN